MKKFALALIISSISLNNGYALEKRVKKFNFKGSERSVKPNKTPKNKPSAQKSVTPPSKTKLAASFADTIAKILPTVVNISALQNADTQTSSSIFDNFEKRFKGHSANSDEKKFSIGSGFLISKDGLIVTNGHVIEETSKIEVSTNDGTKYSAKIIGIDKKTDLALLKINSNKKFQFAEFDNSDESRIGDWVILIGNPYSLGNSVSVGIISALNRNIENLRGHDLIQTDAAINKGNSGGPMFNAHGKVIGINSAIFSPSGENVGIGFATPSKNAAEIIKQLKENGKVTRGWIGISIQTVSDEIAAAMKMKKTQGAFINEIVQNGPADKAGIIPADIILEFDGKKIHEMNDLPKAVSNYQAGKNAEIIIWRNGEQKTLTVKVKKLQENNSEDLQETLEEQQITSEGTSLGLNLATLSGKITKGDTKTDIEGLIIEEIDIESQAAKQGILISDIIISANQNPVVTLADLKAEVTKAQNDNGKLLLLLRRNESNISIVLNLK